MMLKIKEEIFSYHLELFGMPVCGPFDLIVIFRIAGKENLLFMGAHEDR